MIENNSELSPQPLPKPDIDISIDKNDKITDDTDNSLAHKTFVSSGHKKWYKPPYSKKEKWIFVAIALAVLLIIIGGTFLYLHYHDAKPKTTITLTKPKPAVPAVTYQSRLTGETVSLAQSQLPVTGVMIENSDAARPQSGLSSAGVVFEALAEGGITRFLALYQEGEPGSIGPIRSARPYFIDWLLGFDAAYAHVGGSPQALNEITADNVKDMNEFYYGSSYVRIPQRQAPHNVYTSYSNLLAIEKSKGWTTSNFDGFPRKADAPSKTPTAASINLSPSYADMNVHYQYNSANNSYERSEGGAAMIDDNTGKQLDPKVVIAMVIP